jgi:hypothetical protein
MIKIFKNQEIQTTIFRDAFEGLDPTIQKISDSLRIQGYFPATVLFI